MTYNMKDVFFLSISADIDNSTAGGGTAQLDLSAYIDPIARGRTKGTGLAIYKVHFGMSQTANGEPIDDAEAGTLRGGLIAGLGAGDNATGAASFTAAAFEMTNALLVASYDFYGPKSMVANACTTPDMYNTMLIPSTEVPYVIVRDNCILAYDVGDNFTTDHTLAVRLEVAQITLDQSTLNQLLRTQTV